MRAPFPLLLSSMERLSDEIISLILCSLSDPSAFSIVSSRLYNISRDPHVRAIYFLSNYGPNSAFFHALGRGELITPSVLDILLRNGAFLSRYLLQLAVGHYFRGTTPFIKYRWVRSMSLTSFNHLIDIGIQLYGDFPTHRSSDDGSIVGQWLFGQRTGVDTVTSFDKVEEVFVKYRFAPFTSKDPLMPQMPYAFALEPRLLSITRSNGWEMDQSQHNHLFRKVFERPEPVPAEMGGSGQRKDITSVTIVQTVRALCDADPKLFVSRTVAAEICMEARTNKTAYEALKILCSEGNLLFDLGELVTDLLKLFVKTPNVSQSPAFPILRILYHDFPSNSASSRLAVLLSFFVQLQYPTDGDEYTSLGDLEPPTVDELIEILCNPHILDPRPIIAFARNAANVSEVRLRAVAEEVAIKNLSIPSKGGFLKHMLDSFAFLRNIIRQEICKMRIDVDALDEADPRIATALSTSVDYDDSDADTDDEPNEDPGDDFDIIEDEESPALKREAMSSKRSLGTITQDTLTKGIICEELRIGPLRQDALQRQATLHNDTGGRRRFRTKTDYTVAQWVYDEFGTRDPATSVVLTHAIVNSDWRVLQHFVHDHQCANAVPITLRHFKLMAKLGLSPATPVWHALGVVEYYSGEEDYIPSSLLSTYMPDLARRSNRVKVKLESDDIKPISKARGASKLSMRKRPRRQAASAVKSYTVPGSDEELDGSQDDEASQAWTPTSKRNQRQKAKAKLETDLQMWIHHLTVLHKEEEKKYKARKASVREQNSGECVKIAKTEFHKSLTSHLKHLRQKEVKCGKGKRGLLINGETSYYDDDDEEIRTYKRVKLSVA